MYTTLVLIFVLQVIFMTVVTIRLILTVKGYRHIAAPLSAIDILVYTIGLKLVLDNIDQPINLVVYCISYGIGNYIGSKIEELLPIGYVTVQAFSKNCDLSLGAELRHKGFGVTEILADGMDGKSLILTIITNRKNQKGLIEQIKGCDPNSMIVSYESKYIHGGFLSGFYKR